MRVWTCLVCLALALPAVAQDCEEPYTVDALLTNLAESEAALRSNDFASANTSASAMAAGLGCLDDIIPSIMLPRVFRAVGGSMFVGGDPDEAFLWLRTAAQLDPSFTYSPDQLPEGSPVHSAWKLAMLEAEGESQSLDRDFADGSHFLDGTMIQAPTAVGDRFHIYQRVLDETYTFLIQGAEFPEEAFGPIGEEPEEVITEVSPQDALVEAATAEVEVEVEVDEPEDTVFTPEAIQSKAWPTERVVLVGAGGASLAASGILWSMSASSRAKFDQSGTVGDMDNFQASTNTLFLSSAASAGVGAGLLGVGVLFFVVDGDPRPTLDIRF